MEDINKGLTRFTRKERDTKKKRTYTTSISSGYSPKKKEETIFFVDECFPQVLGRQRTRPPYPRTSRIQRHQRIRPGAHRLLNRRRARPGLRRKMERNQRMPAGSRCVTTTRWWCGNRIRGADGAVNGSAASLLRRCTENGFTLGSTTMVLGLITGVRTGRTSPSRESLNVAAGSAHPGRTFWRGG